jgi:hypothetical protein
MKRIGLAVLAALAMGLFVAGPALAQSPYPVQDPTIDVDDRTVTGQDWCPGSTVTIFVDGDEVGEADVDADGNFTFEIPDSVSDGEHDIVVEGLKSDCTTVFSAEETAVLGAPTAPTGANVTVGVIAIAALLIVGAGAVIAGRRARITK